MDGTDDETLPAACSRDVRGRARRPEELVLYSGCRHGLDRCREELGRKELGRDLVGRR